MIVNNNKIIEEVAIELGLPITTVDKVIKSIFIFIRHTIKEGSLKSIRLIHFGIFVAKKKIDYFINKPEKKALAIERLKLKNSSKLNK